MLKIGDILKAVQWCGFPDYTTKGKEYTVSKVEEFTDRVMFYIINDNGEEIFPISTVFILTERAEEHESV